MQTRPRLRLRAGQLEVTLARTLAELDAAKRLRFEVFNLELQEGLLASYRKGYDSDAYDAYCEHLIVKDLALDKVVGTYRLLRQSVAERQIGFYSENEFDLHRIKELPGESLELGRSCVAQAYRSFAVINLLWNAIGQYAVQTGIESMFGCASLHTAEVAEVAELHTWLRRRHFAPERFRVQPQPGCRMEFDEAAAWEIDERAVGRRVPPILKGYLRAGAMVCGAPAFDAEFGTADVLVLLETARITARYQQHYNLNTVAEIN